MFDDRLHIETNSRDYFFCCWPYGADEDAFWFFNEHHGQKEFHVSHWFVMFSAMHGTRWYGEA